LSPALTAQRVHLEKSAGEIVLIVERGRDTHRFALSEPALAELLTSAQALKE
jgi:hypothetical protein